MYSSSMIYYEKQIEDRTAIFMWIYTIFVFQEKNNFTERRLAENLLTF